MGSETFVEVILAILLPPVGVFLRYGVQIVMGECVEEVFVVPTPSIDGLHSPTPTVNLESNSSGGRQSAELGGNVDGSYSHGLGDVDNSCDDMEVEVQVPTKGMTFRSWEEVETMYKVYGKVKGFGISRTQAASNVKHERRAMTWKCECWGIPNLRQVRERKRMEKEMGIGGSMVVEKPKYRRRKSKKCGCGAMLYASVNKEEWWEVRQVVLEHTGHIPKACDSRLVKEYRMQSFTSSMRKRVLNDVDVGVPIDQIHGSIARERDGLANMPVTPKDMRHVADEARKLKFKGGDAAALSAYLDSMCRDNKEFYYSIRMDVTGGLQDVLWVDARSKAAYEEFGDVVCFDTTYMTNEYELPFANFVGVNYHGQTTLFGCALVSHEDIETFTWVFEKWLLCMGGKAPAAILTDQAPAMRRAIADIFPKTTTHRWCIWHIMEKIPKKLGGFSKYKKMKKAIKDVVYNSFSQDVFEKRWPQVMKKYKLRRNEWLMELYEERSMWVPAFMRDTFWAGMRTTQRVESIHSFFDKFVKTHTKLIEFGEKYIAAVEKRICQERDADDRDRKWHREAATNFAIELYFAPIYTDEKFLEFSKQCERVAYGFVAKESFVDEKHKEYVIDDSVWVFKEGCRTDFHTPMRRLYKLVFDVESHHAVCECRLFETHGIMCRHIVRVLFQNSIVVPPPMYVLDRWKKNVDRKHTRIKVSYHDPRRSTEVKRLDRMQNVFDVLSDKACLEEGRTRKVIETLTRLIEEIDIADARDEGDGTEAGHASQTLDQREERETMYRQSQQALFSNSPTFSSANPGCSPLHTNPNISQTLRDPVRRKKRGRPKGSRLKGEAEKAIEKSKSRKSKKNQGTSSESSDTSKNDDSDQGSPSPPSLPNTRSKTVSVGRRRTKKRLEDEFNSSGSSDMSVSF